ncbi:MAG: OmpH family outer membrane protein [Bacteroidota bacterium]
MKNISLIISAISLVGVVILYGIYFTTNNTEPSDDKNINDTLSVTNSGSGNIAYIKVDSLLMEYNFYQDLEDQIKTRKAEMEAELTRQAKALEKDMAAFQNKVQNNLFLSEQSYNSQADELYKKRENLALSEQQLSEKLMNESLVLEQQILDTVLNFVRIFNSDKRYRYIINGGNLLYGEKTDDITDTVLSLMNQRYKLQKEAQTTTSK